MRFICTNCPSGWDSNHREGSEACYNKQDKFNTEVIVGVGICAALVVGVFAIYRFRKKNEEHEIELEIKDDVYRLLEDDLQETKNDNSKLQQARIIKLTDIKLAEVIGKGAFGEVFKGRWRGLDVASPTSYWM